jgi:uridine phosphorylase
VAEQLFASGCRLLISITSAGQIAPVRQPPYFVLIDRALRDEGGSYHYRPPSRFAHAPDGHLQAKVEAALRGAPEIAALRGASWTTDAPFRETEAAIDRARELGALAVEMEAAALYALAAARRADVICIAHVTNAMGRTEGDFEKGEADGVTASLRVAAAMVRGWRDSRSTVDKGGGT